MSDVSRLTKAELIEEIEARTDSNGKELNVVGIAEANDVWRLRINTPASAMACARIRSGSREAMWDRCTDALTTAINRPVRVAVPISVESIAK